MATKKKMSPWIQFVMKVKSENPTMDFKDVLKLAGKLKKQGKKMDVVQSKTKKVNKKIKNMKKRGKSKTGKRVKKNKRSKTRKN